MFDWFTKWITKKKLNIYTSHSIRSSVYAVGTRHNKDWTKKKKTILDGKVDGQWLWGYHLFHSFISFASFVGRPSSSFHQLLLNLRTNIHNLSQYIRCRIIPGNTFYTSWFDDFIRHFNWDWLLCSYRIENVHHNFKSNKS